MIFITFEGIDGSGKTTIAKIIKDKLIQKGYNILLTREPGGEKIAEQIRKLILDKKNTDMTPWTETLLYVASRKQHLDNVIVPALKNKTIVICDRFMDSTSAYQGFGRKIGITDVDELQNIVLGYMKPDLTIFFDITPKDALPRLIARHKESDRLDNESLEFHNRVYEGYKILISNNNERFRIVDARLGVNEVSQQVEFLIQATLDEKLHNYE